MKKIKVIVKDRNTLVLDEDAIKGDYINLSELNEVDFRPAVIKEKLMKGNFEFEHIISKD